MSAIARKLVMAAMIVAASSGARAQGAPPMSPGVAALHDELRGVKQRLIEAVNKKDPAALFAEMAPNVVFTAMNNDVVHGVEAGRAYYARMLEGSSSVLNDVSITADADELSQLLANNSVAIAAGTSNTHFDLRGGLKFDVPLRWTGTFDRSTGHWKVAALHFSANIENNPLLTAATAFWKWATPIVGAAALALGLFFGRRTRQAS